MKIRSLTIFILGLVIIQTGCANRIKKKDAQIYFERTACFGTCPIFKFTLHHDGSAIYEGIRFTDNLGTFKTQYSSDDTKAIFNLMKNGDWANFKEDYPTYLSDLPSTVIGYKYKKINKQVTIKGEHPILFDSFASELDKMIGSAKWKSTTYK